MITSPAHSLAPDDTAVSVFVPDCDECIYVDGLTPFTQYYLRARTFNDIGPSDYASHVAVMPQEVCLAWHALRQLNKYIHSHMLKGPQFYLN